jgi:zinc protease
MSYRLLPYRLLCSTMFSAALLAASACHAAIDLDAKIPPGPQVKVGKLANGLTYYIQRNGKPEHRLELRLAVKAGSVLEDDDQLGLAHFTEHLAFNGSTHFRKQELVTYLQSIGVKMGADLNATTSYDETTYILPVPTGRKEDVEKAFTILEDWAHGLTLDAADIDKERTIVLEELRLHKGIQQRIDKVVMPKLFAGSRYPQRDPIGNEELIRTFKPDTLRRFYRDWYRPDLMAVVAVGDIDPADAERAIAAHFGGLANPAAERARTYDDIRTKTDTEAVVLTDPEMTSNIVSLQYPVRFAPDAGTYGGYREKLVQGLFTLMLNLRLAELAQAPTPPFLGAGAGVASLTTRHKAYTATATLGAGGSAPALAALMQEQARVRQYGFTAPELERASKIMLSSFERGYNERTTTNSATFAAEYIRNFLAGEPIQGIEAERALVQTMLPGIALGEIDAYARRTLAQDSGKLVLYIGGTATPAPAGPQLLADALQADHAPVAARTEKQLASRLMEPPAQPGAIVAESIDKTLGLTRLTLSNGVKVILKPTAFSKEQVLLSARRYGGQTLFDPVDIVNARYASAVVKTMGLKDFSPLDLGKVLAGRTASIDLSLNTYTDDVRGASGSSRDDIETMLQMLWQRFAGVRRDEGLYRTFIASQRELLRNRLAQPEARFSDVVIDTVYAHHAYEPRALVPAELDQLSLDRGIAIYRQRFASAKNMTFILVGDFEIDKIKPLLASYLGTLPTPDLALAYRDVGLGFAHGVVRKEVDAGTEPKSLVSLTFTGPATWSLPESRRLYFLTEVMNLRIYSVLREKLGLIYGGAMGSGMQRIPSGRYSIGTTLPTGPEKVDQLVAALFAEIARLKADGPEPAELDKVKESWRQGYARRQRENGFWLNGLEESELDGTDPSQLITQAREVDALTAADIQRAAQRYFDTANYVQVVLNPQKPALTTTAARN